MKKTAAVFALLLLIVFVPAAALAAPDPLDLAKMRSAGLSEETIVRVLTQNLSATRLAPPVDAAFLMRLAEYGGDELARSYLDLDLQSVSRGLTVLPLADIEKMMDGGLAAADLKTIIDGETLKAAHRPAEVELPQVEPVPASEPLVTETEDLLPAQPAEAPLKPRNPVVSAAPAINPPAGPGGQVVAAPAPAAVPVPPPPAAPVLRRGQAADPALPIPQEYITPQPRYPSQPGPWMGVMEQELPDGHRYEVNLNGDPAMVGQEFMVRPSGRPVYRYYVGQPDSPRSGADSRQEAINQENLRIIHEGSNND